MPNFLFSARDSAGRSQSGTLSAVTPAAVVDSLRGRGWLVLNVRPAADTKVSSTGFRWPEIELRPPKSVEIELCFQQLSTMLRAGLTLLDALTTLAKQATRKPVRRVWDRVVGEIQQGLSLADSLAKHKCFPAFAVQLVRVGEQTGQLETVLVQAAEAMESRRNLRTSLVTALMYPTLVLVAAFGVTAFMILHVIPKLQVFLKALGKKLPPMTQVLLDVSAFCQTHGMWLAIAMVVAFGGLIATYAWPPGRLALDQFVLRIPVVGLLLRLSGTVWFARGMHTLLSSGITLLEALRTIERMHRNRFLSGRVAAARETVMQGGSLADPLSVRHAFMPLLSSMVAVGESSGTLDEVLKEVARFHEMQMQATLRRMSTLIEPAITVIVGGIVGYVYISFFLALFAAGT